MACLLIGSLFSASNLGFGALEDVRLIFCVLYQKARVPSSTGAKKSLVCCLGKWANLVVMYRFHFFWFSVGLWFHVFLKSGFWAVLGFALSDPSS